MIHLRQPQWELNENVPDGPWCKQDTKKSSVPLFSLSPLTAALLLFRSALILPCLQDHWPLIKAILVPSHRWLPSTVKADQAHCKAHLGRPPCGGLNEPLPPLRPQGSFTIHQSMLGNCFKCWSLPSRELLEASNQMEFIFATTVGNSNGYSENTRLQMGACTDGPRRASAWKVSAEFLHCTEFCLP